MNFSSFLAGTITDTRGRDFEVFVNLSRYGVSLNESVIDFMRNIHAPHTATSISARE